MAPMGNPPAASDRARSVFRSARVKLGSGDADVNGDVMDRHLMQPAAFATVAATSSWPRPERHRRDATVEAS
jgi:hypothetical protein